MTIFFLLLWVFHICRCICVLRHMLSKSHWQARIFSYITRDISMICIFLFIWLGLCVCVFTRCKRPTLQLLLSLLPNLKYLAQNFSIFSSASKNYYIKRCLIGTFFPKQKTKMLIK